MDTVVNIASAAFSLGVAFPLRVASDLSVIPSIGLLKRNQRHFEMYIGIFHVFISCMTNGAELYGKAYNAPLFLAYAQWSNILDVLWLAFLYLLVVHHLSIKNENINIILRYVGFSLAWIMRVKDGPYEHSYSLLMVLVGFSLVVVRRLVFRDQFMQPLRKAGAAISVALALFCTGVYLFAYDIPVDGVILRSVFYCCLGAFFYFGWKCAPPPMAAAKKWDDCDVVTSDYI